MAQRRGPAAGYDFGSKRQYRRDVYAQFRRACDGCYADKAVAFLPSIEGHEIDVALKSGFRQHNLHVIDDNPAIVATLRKRYPRIHTYGVSAELAAERIASAGGVHFVNLDLCGPIGEPLRKTLSSWMSSGALREGGAIAVTVLRGREKAVDPVPVKTYSATRLYGSEVTVPAWHRDMYRLGWISATLSGFDNPHEIASGARVRTEDWACARWTAYLTRNGTYKSTAGSQTMLWGAWKIHSKACLCDECLVVFRQLLGSKTLHRATIDKLALLRSAGWGDDDIRSACQCTFGRRDEPMLLTDSASARQAAAIGW